MNLTTVMSQNDSQFIQKVLEELSKKYPKNKKIKKALEIINEAISNDDY